MANEVTTKLRTIHRRDCATRAELQSGSLKRKNSCKADSQQRLKLLHRVEQTMLILTTRCFRMGCILQHFMKRKLVDALEAIHEVLMVNSFKREALDAKRCHSEVSERSASPFHSTIRCRFTNLHNCSQTSPPTPPPRSSPSYNRWWSKYF